MTTADTSWPDFYRALQQFRQAGIKLQAAGAAADISAILLQSAQLSRYFTALAGANSVSIIAQLNLTPRHMSPVLTRALKMLALGLIFSHSFGWQRPRSQYLLQAILVSAAFSPDNASSVGALVSAAKRLQQSDQNNKQAPLALLIGACNSQRQPAWQLHPDGPLLASVCQLAELLSPQTGQQIGLEQLLSNYQSHRAETAKWFSLLDKLAKLQALPGRFASVKVATDKPVHYWFISGVVPHSELAESAQVYVRQFDPASKAIGSEVAQAALADLTLLNPQFFRDISWLTLLEPDPGLLVQPTEYTLQNCFDASLFHKLTGLNISKQVQLLESRPELSHFLQQAATGLSRQQLPVNRLRHAITMLGQDALQDWVAQAELDHYCQHHRHPYQGWLEQLQHCLTESLRLLSAATPMSVPACMAGVIARCLSVSLWQHPVLPHTALARQVRQQQLLGVYIRQHIWQAEHYSVQARQLLDHYQQPDWSEAMQTWHSPQPAPLTQLLRLSWQLAMTVFFADNISYKQFAASLQTAATRLNLTRHPASYWQQQLISASQCYYPLAEM
ncbi:hypothetical protein [Arsukibacterium sp.]|uniref:hypothetical protein n=1 Tax=Arsukibacterium sp. TaxID=1977258 RepID=UPI00299F1F82|nr:hypothetical protein [Arsukibacterium sp.]MDX1677083.1 hypothetical protein [Arsukibacterium sp.]